MQNPNPSWKRDQFTEIPTPRLMGISFIEMRARNSLQINQSNYEKSHAKQFSTNILGKTELKKDEKNYCQEHKQNNISKHFLFINNNERGDGHYYKLAASSISEPKKPEPFLLKDSRDLTTKKLSTKTVEKRNTPLSYFTKEESKNVLSKNVTSKNLTSNVLFTNENPNDSELKKIGFELNKFFNIKGKQLRLNELNCCSTSGNKKANFLLFGGIDPYFHHRQFHQKECHENEQIYDIHQNGKNVLTYSFSKNKWLNISSMPGSRHHHSAVYCNGKIYVIGGTRPACENQKSVISKSVWSFDPIKLEWHTETSLPCPRRDFVVIKVDDDVKEGFFVIGGEDSEKKILSTTLFYDIKTKTWEKRASMNIARSGLMAIAITNSGNNKITTHTNDDYNGIQNSKITKKKVDTVSKKIWAAGGLTNIQNITITDIIEEYDINIDKWTKIGQLRIPRCFGKFCLTNENEIFLIGGLSNVDGDNISLNFIDKYDDQTKKWILEAKLPLARHGHDVLQLNDKIFIFGGVSTVGPTSFYSVECYDIKAKNFNNKIASMPIPLSGLAAVKIE